MTRNTRVHGEVIISPFTPVFRLMRKAMPGELTYREIISQPDAWAEALAAFEAREAAVAQAWTAAAPRHVLFTGCGSTHYLSLSAAALFTGLTGVPATGRPASELILFFDQVVPDPAETLLIAVSRSGTTTETLAAVERFRAGGGRAVWVVTCYPDSPLATAADLVLPAAAAQEESVAQTRSFASMLLLCQALAACLGGADWRVLHRLPALGRDLIAAVEPLMMDVGGRLSDERLYFLGSGPFYGVASEAMLKMTEMSLTAAQAFHFLEFRHGPMSMVEPGTQVIGLLSPAAAGHEARVLDEMLAMGAAVLRLGGADDGATWHVALPPGLPEWARLVLYLPPLQLLAYHRACAKGLDPDRPRHLSAVVYLGDLSGNR